ncbi:MAG: hypothetical protein ACYC21_09530 [Eubacteriales bacterium]
MKREVGDKNYHIWLLGDSEPVNWQQVLETPFDPRHPIRHNIWTSILDVIQDNVFRAIGNRIDTSVLYIRNAVGDPSHKPPGNQTLWDSDILKNELNYYQRQCDDYKPIMILCFGAFSFEFARRTLDEQTPRQYNYWGARHLGEEFVTRTISFDVNKTNIIPLLHRSIAGGKFIQSHEYFCNIKGSNYFEYVGNKLSEIFLSTKHSFNIWIK